VERLAPQVVAVQFDQVEGVEEDVAVMAALAQPVEYRQAVVVASHRFAVDQARDHAQREHWDGEASWLRVQKESLHFAPAAMAGAFFVMPRIARRRGWMSTN
jgi:hypothetical protein